MARRAFSRDLKRFIDCIDTLQGENFTITSIQENDDPFTVEILAIFNKEKYRITVCACNEYPFKQPELSIRKCEYVTPLGAFSKEEEQEVDDDIEDELEYFKDVVVKSPYEHWGMGWSSTFIWLFLDWFPVNEISFK
jgi:hypothetical protein